MKVRVWVEAGQGQDLVEKSAQRRLTEVWPRRGPFSLGMGHADAHKH